MRSIVESLRAQLQQCRRDEAPLAKWRELQLEILDAAKKLKGYSKDQQPGARDAPAASRAALWSKLSDPFFFFERDLVRLALLIEEVIVALEDHDEVPASDRAEG